MFAPIGVTFLWLYARKSEVRREVKRMIINGIDKSQLVKLQFSTQEQNTLLRWEHSKEFEFDGNMYDIVEAIQLEDSIIYYCWLDKAETELNRQLSELTKDVFDKDSKKRTCHNQLMKYYKSIYCCDIFNWKSELNEIFLVQSVNYDNKYSSLAPIPHSPPPVLC